MIPIILVLNNDSIYQLNLISADRLSKCSSLLSVIDSTVTSMGKRLLKERILYPITDVKTLENRYDMVDKMKENQENCVKFSKILSDICDIEKKHRRANLQKLSPGEFYMLTFSYNTIVELLKITPMFFKVSKLTEKFLSFKNEYEKIFNVENMKDIQLNSIKQSFFNEGIYTDIDEINTEISHRRKKLNNIASLYSLCISNNTTTSVKLIKSDSDGYYLSCTPSKVSIIKNKYPEIIFTKLKSYARITSKEILEHSEKLCELENTIGILAKKKYVQTISNLYIKYKLVLQRVVDIISELDVVCSSAKVAIKYVYNRPVIKQSNKSFVNITELRHPIIERIIDKEYEVNDINLTEKNGMLIYGVNSSGKSSIIRALGCNIVLAQAGMFVSSKTFEYYPYTLLLSKISCTDNLFKGHSTYISEALEVRNIIQRCDNKTMVLADELCSGTEGLSATSLVCSTILHLAKINATFMFSTHLQFINGN